MLYVRWSLKPIAVQITSARLFQEREETWICQISSFGTLKHFNATELIGRDCCLGTWVSLKSCVLF